MRDLVEARAVAAQAVASEARVAEQIVARQALRTEDVLESRSWTPQPVPEQRLRAEYQPSASDELLRRARERLAEDRRAISGPLARVTPLEPTFDDLVEGERAASSGTDRRLAPTAPALPVREVELAPAPADRAPQVEPAARYEQAVAAAHALDVTRADAPLETQTDEHMIIAGAGTAPAAGSKFASMGLVDDDLGGMDVHEAFLRRVG